MSIETYSSELLAYIKHDILIKYKTSNPAFIINNKQCNEAAVLKWMDNKFIFLRWVQYRNIGENQIELKDFYPNPSNAYCLKIINELLHDCNEGHEKIFFRINQSIYTEFEAKNYFFYILKKGYSEIFLPSQVSDPILKLHRTIYEASGNEVELYHRVNSGYMELEYHEQPW